MSFLSSTRKQELHPNLSAFFELLHRHKHSSSDISSKISFLNLKDIPASLISALTGEDPLVRNVRPKLLELVDDQWVVVDSIIPDGVTKEFKLPWKTIANSESVFLQGRRLRRDVDYTLNAEYLTFTEAPPFESIILVDLSPLAPSPDPTSPKYVVNEIPLQQFEDLVFFTRQQTNTETLQVYRQGIRCVAGGTDDHVILSRQRFRFNYPIADANVLIDYQTAFGSNDLYIKTHSFTSEQNSNLNQTVFILPEVPRTFTEQVYIAGQRKKRDTDYSIVEDQIQVLDGLLMSEETSFLVDYQTEDTQVLQAYKTHIQYLNTPTTAIELESSSLEIVLVGTHQVYVNGLRKEFEIDYTISGSRNELITLQTAQSDCYVIVDYQI